MTREFLDKVKRLGVYDTRNYRYIARACGEYMHIERLPLKDLDTMSAFDEWDVVAVYTGIQAL